jgi:hypothetical protein
MESMTVMAAKWKNQEVRGYNGLVCSNGDIYDVHETWMARVHEKQELGSWLNVAILAQEELYGGQYIVKCGEAAEHGSIGVVVLESLQNHDPVWTFVSDQSNPFDQIIIKGSLVLVLSTSGAVLRFGAPMREARLLLPSTQRVARSMATNR